MKQVKTSKPGLPDLPLGELSRALNSMTAEDFQDKEVKRTVLSIIGVRR